MKKGIIFDMDGTLWDSAEGIAVSWNEVLKERGLSVGAEVTADSIHAVMGKTMDVIAEELFPNLSEEEQLSLLEACCKRENAYLEKHGGVLYPRLEETLKELHEEYPLYIVSNCQSGYIEAFLSYYHLEQYFEDTECYGNNNRKKGDNIALVVQRSGLTDAVYIGDIQGDYDASMQAGVRFVHAAYGFGDIKEETAAIQNLTELPGVITAIW